MLENVILAYQRVEKSSHAEYLTNFELRIDKMVLKLNCHLLFILVQYAVIERALRSLSHNCKLLLHTLTKFYGLFTLASSLFGFRLFYLTTMISFGFIFS